MHKRGVVGKWCDFSRGRIPLLRVRIRVGVVVDAEFAAVSGFGVCVRVEGGAGVVSVVAELVAVTV